MRHPPISQSWVAKVSFETEFEFEFEHVLSLFNIPPPIS